MSFIDFSRKTFLVTGASSGVGTAISIYLSKLGARVVLVGRNSEKMEATKGLLDSTQEHIVAPFDLSNTASIPDWMERTASKTGLLNGFVHGAGLLSPRPLSVLEDPDFRATIALTVEAGLALAKGYQRIGVGSRPGSIVFVATSKGAFQMFAPSIAMDLAREKIRLNFVTTSLVNTNVPEDLERQITQDQFKEPLHINPHGVTEPVDVAAAVTFYLSDASRIITGTTLSIDRGYMPQS